MTVKRGCYMKWDGTEGTPQDLDIYREAEYDGDRLIF